MYCPYRYPKKETSFDIPISEQIPRQKNKKGRSEIKKQTRYYPECPVL
jgi:hypothetical protein